MSGERRRLASDFHLRVHVSMYILHACLLTQSLSLYCLTTIQQCRQESSLQNSWCRWSPGEMLLLMGVTVGWWSCLPSSSWASPQPSSRTLAFSSWTSRVTLGCRPAPPHGWHPPQLPRFTWEVKVWLTVCRCYQCTPKAVCLFFLSSFSQSADVTVFSESGHHNGRSVGFFWDAAGISGPQSALALPHNGCSAR